ncbi:AI-2E family transporter [Halomarina pelagica]|uniref:AI-2E family transporter n=1 Tax=Halomarina pelagica TaxID=2961599 RepID=UPI0020C2D7A5|nr:AI-2E family transporter [Halomarina sp. BND7]
MDHARHRRAVLAGVLLAFAVLAALVLFEVLGTVFFAVTVAYVLVPIRNYAVGRGLSRRVAAAIVATGAFAAVLGIVAALGYVVYQRRGSIVSLIESLPPRFVVPIGGSNFVVETAAAQAQAIDALQAVAADVAAAVPVLVLKLFLFAILLFGLLLRPNSAGRALFSLVPGEYHDVLVALDDRVRQTLYGIYVLQAATAFGTFLVALVVFFALGYDSVFTLAVIAGLLQFIPVLGPGVLVGALALVDLLVGNTTRAVLVAVIGAVVVGAAPDAIIRPRLASWAADLPTSLYFIGFVGGILTVGAIGVIAGPLVVALVVEMVEILSRDDDLRARLDAALDADD